MGTRVYLTHLLYRHNGHDFNTAPTLFRSDMPRCCSRLLRKKFTVRRTDQVHRDMRFWNEPTFRRVSRLLGGRARSVAGNHGSTESYPASMLLSHEYGDKTSTGVSLN